jgi:hypothetical protein
MEPGYNQNKRHTQVTMKTTWPDSSAGMKIPPMKMNGGVYQGGLRFYGFTDYKGMTIADWSHQQKYDLNISGASNNASYYASFGFIDKEGWAELPRDKNYMYKRYNVLMKGDFKINEWLTMDSQINWSRRTQRSTALLQLGCEHQYVARVKPNHMVISPISLLP